jgi:succinoglycan biosynthesis transport protein ExoP
MKDPTGSSVPRSVLLAQQLRLLRAKYTPDHPDVKALERELELAKQEEAEQPVAAPAAAEIVPARTSPELLQLRERISTLRAQIDVAKHQIASSEKDRDRAAGQIAETQSRVGRLPLVEQQMAELKRNYDQSLANYNSLLQKQLAAGMATDMERSPSSERFRVVDPAHPPQVPEKPKRAIIGALGSVGGLVISVMIALGLEFRRGVLLGEWELPPDVVVLGRVPTIEPSGANA